MRFIMLVQVQALFELVDVSDTLEHIALEAQTGH